MLLGLMVAARIGANPISNVFQKRLTQHAVRPVLIVAATHALLAAACAPLLLFGPARLETGAAFWANMLACGVLAASSNVLLVAALRSGDLSVLGPINAYKPVVGLLLGIVLVGEIPTPMGVAGVALILAGSMFVVERGAGIAGFWRGRGVALRFAALALSATEAVFLKRTILLSSPVTTFVFWSIVGLPMAAAGAALLPRGEWARQTAVLRVHWRTLLGLAASTGVMQSATLFTFDRMQVGASLALFQLSSLLAVFLGGRCFQEGDLRRRFLAATAMAAGAALIVVYGRPA